MSRGARRDSFSPDLELSEFFTKLWELDENKCIPNEDYDMNKQGFVKSTRNERDFARSNLFRWVNEENVFTKPTYKTFVALLDNYRSETGLPEIVTPEEEAENKKFINAIMDTKVMQEAHEFLVSKDKAPKDEMAFKILLYKTWFWLYRRTKGDRDFDSSGFEHVFVGETRGSSQVIGFHNWIQFYLEEKVGNIDYKGYFRNGTDDDPDPRLITLQFDWKGDRKPIGSSFIGTSPEFEIALYTVCYLLNIGDKIPLAIAEHDVLITVYRMGGGIGTAFPQAK